MIAWIKKLFGRTPKPVPAYSNVTLEPAEGNRRYLKITPVTPPVSLAEARASLDEARAACIRARNNARRKSYGSLSAPYGPAPAPSPSSSDDIYAAVAMGFLSQRDEPIAAPEPQSCAAPSFSSGGGGDFGGAGASSSWDSDSSSDSSSSSSSSSSD